MKSESAEPEDVRANRQEAVAKWKEIVAKYRKPNRWRANWQILNTVGVYIGLWYLMYLSLSISWWLTIPLAVLAGGLLIRAFIIFHDCGHGSFFKSRRANAFWGFITGVLTFTPYYHWRWEHAIHHATTGDLNHRGVGDIWTLTVKEYLESSRWKKFSYRLIRNPFVLFVLGPLFLLLIRQRFPNPGAKPREKRSVWIMNLTIFGVAAGLISIYGFLPWLIIQLTATAVAGTCGVWLFYIQHQFEDAYWERNEEWDYTDAAMKGSSFYKLPKVLQWFSGNIGFHHIHHLSPRIPNYNLERCHRSDPMFTEVEAMTIFGSLKTVTYRLWDEEAKKLISFRRLRKQKKERAAEEESEGANQATNDST